nr:MAG TPA_asm: hypothetical protein [Bacteriophage sp.]
MDYLQLSNGKRYALKPPQALRTAAEKPQGLGF